MKETPLVNEARDPEREVRSNILPQEKQKAQGEALLVGEKLKKRGISSHKERAMQNRISTSSRQKTPALRSK
jgi:hypothetical protein